MKYVELERFEVIAGKELLVVEWMDFLREHLPLVCETLPGEKMYVESIFSEQTAGKYYLYWVSYQGMPCEEVTSSDCFVDQKHLEYWRKCIVPNSGMLLQTEVVMIHPEIQMKVRELDDTDALISEN
jgi:hypothetical protein